MGTDRIDLEVAWGDALLSHEQLGRGQAYELGAGGLTRARERAFISLDARGRGHVLVPRGAQLMLTGGAAYGRFCTRAEAPDGLWVDLTPGRVVEILHDGVRYTLRARSGPSERVPRAPWIRPWLLAAVACLLLAATALLAGRASIASAARNENPHRIAKIGIVEP